MDASPQSYIQAEHMARAAREYNIENKRLQQLNTEYFQTVIVADGNPVWLSWWPLYLVDFSSSRVCENWILDGSRHLLDVPDECLSIVGCHTYTLQPISSVLTNHNHSKWHTDRHSRIITIVFCNSKQTTCKVQHKLHSKQITTKQIKSTFADI